MAKTIKELAKENTTKYGDVEAVSYLYFIKGANAVLEAVEGCMYDKEYTLYYEGIPYIDGKVFFNRLEDLIKQLKGE